MGWVRRLADGGALGDVLRRALQEPRPVVPSLGKASIVATPTFERKVPLDIRLELALDAKLLPAIHFGRRRRLQIILVSNGGWAELNDFSWRDGAFRALLPFLSSSTPLAAYEVVRVKLT